MPWLRHFALFLVFVAVFRPAAAGAFVSAPDAGPQARVGAFELVAATLVGPASGATCGLHEGIGAAYDENASGYRFAARGAPKLLPAPTGVNPWAGTSVSTTAAENLTMYRVWGGESSQVGSWLTPVRPASASAARSALALPEGNAATFVSEVTVPAGTRFQIGVAGPAFGQPGGAVQVQLLDRIPASSFGVGMGF